MEFSKSNRANSAIIGIYRLLIIFFVLFTLYFAQTILVLLALAGLLTFLLSPLVSKLEKWIGRTSSVFLVVLIVFSLIGFSGYVFSKQLVRFASDFPTYKENVEKKLSGIKLPDWKIFNVIHENVQNLFTNDSVAAHDTTTSPIEVKLLDMGSGFINFFHSFFGSFFDVIGSSAVVLLLVIFMLFRREDIRSRIIRLMGQRSISTTTNALDDASDRVFGYLFRLFIVNICFGIAVSIGLYFIGIPSPILWGSFAAIFRFIPYIGVWIASVIPILLSFVTTDSFIQPVLTLSWFILLEVITANMIEPVYYGKKAGISSFALIVSALFWTWFWGPIGLLLSTPLTVCLVVIGQHMPNMKFLSTLLSEEEPLTPAEECYHRLLSYDSNQAEEVVEAYLKKNSNVSLYDSILIPVIAQTEMDFHSDIIDFEKKEEVYQGLREILEFQSISIQKNGTVETIPQAKILCLSEKHLRDELGSSILAKFFESLPYEIYQKKTDDLNELFETVEKVNPDLIFLTAVTPFVLSHMQYLCSRLHQANPNVPIYVCIFGSNEEITIEKLNLRGVREVLFSLQDVSKAIENLKK